jgi:cytochrome P450
LDPPPGLRTLQAGGALTRVLLWDGSTPWLVTRHAQQRALLADCRISADPNQDGYPHQSSGMQGRLDEGHSLFIVMDDPEHARLRRMVSGEFTVRRVEAMRPGIQRIVDTQLEEMLVGPVPADLVSAFALPVPSLVICQLLGVPYADREFFQRAGRTLVKRDTPAEAAHNAQNELLGFLDHLIKHKLADPDDDLLSRVAAEQVRTGKVTRQELAAMGFLLLVAGHETTANMIALGTLALLTHPDQLAAVRDADDPRQIAAAVEELLRYLSVVHSGRRRVALEDIEIAGEVIRAGEGVILPSEIADRDPSVFPNPDMLDVRREAKGHMAFAFGVHQCLGQSLARLELQVVYGTLFRRVPSLTLAVDPARLEFKHDGIVYGVYELPVNW